MVTGDFGGGGLFDDLLTYLVEVLVKSSGRAYAWADLRHDIEITLEKAAFGVEKEVEIFRMESCIKCQMRGKARCSKTCPTCGGMRSSKKSAKPWPDAVYKCYSMWKLWWAW